MQSVVDIDKTHPDNIKKVLSNQAKILETLGINNEDSTTSPASEEPAVELVPEGESMEGPENNSEQPDLEHGVEEQPNVEPKSNDNLVEESETWQQKNDTIAV